MLSNHIVEKMYTSGIHFVVTLFTSSWHSAYLVAAYVWLEMKLLSSVKALVGGGLWGALLCGLFSLVVLWVQRFSHLLATGLSKYQPERPRELGAQLPSPLTGILPLGCKLLSKAMGATCNASSYFYWRLLVKLVPAVFVPVIVITVIIS